MLAACGGHAARPDPKMSAQDVVDHLAKQRAARTSFVADTNMDFWLGNQRTKGEVLIMGAVGSKLRFAALSPAGGSTMAEMACDGKNFVYVDYQNNCTLSGPCDQRSIAQFFRIDLQPDDFIHLALGTPPVGEGTPALTWDGTNENLVVGDETIAVRPDTWDVATASIKGGWSIENKDFVEVDGQRVPGKTRFRSAANQQDLLVDWGSASNRHVNTQLPDDKFKLEAPAGLPPCKH